MRPLLQTIWQQVPTTSNPFPPWVRHMHPSLGAAEKNHLYRYFSQPGRIRTRAVESLAGIIAVTALLLLFTGTATILAVFLFGLALFFSTFQAPKGTRMDALQLIRLRDAWIVRRRLDLWMCGVSGAEITQAAYIQRCTGMVGGFWGWLTVFFLLLLIYLYAMPSFSCVHSTNTVRSVL